MLQYRLVCFYWHTPDQINRMKTPHLLYIEKHTVDQNKTISFWFHFVQPVLTVFSFVSVLVHWSLLRQFQHFSLCFKLPSLHSHSPEDFYYSASLPSVFASYFIDRNVGSRWHGCLYCTCAILLRVLLFLTTAPLMRILELPHVIAKL